MTPSEPPDALVPRARAGDEAAWGVLYERLDGRLVAWLASLPSGDAAVSAEDLAAEAWLTAAAKIGQFRGGDEDFAGWLFGIGRNLLNNRRRMVRRRRTDPDEVDPMSPRWGSVEDASALVAGQEETRRLLSHLSPREAEVVACIDVVGLDVASTARALGISATAVRVARHRALGRLRKILE